jgi:hypothetical protein
MTYLDATKRVGLAPSASLPEPYKAKRLSLIKCLALEKDCHAALSLNSLRSCAQS